MSQPKENSTVAQASSGLNMEAAIKFLPRVSSNEKYEPEFKDGDGGGGPSDVLQFLIEVALNGFMVTITYDDLGVPDEKYIVQTMDEVTELLKKKF